MPLLNTFPDQETFNWQEFREDSRQLDEFATRDFSSMTQELADVLTHGDPEPRFLPIVWRVARDLAIQYVRQPTRTFTGGTVAQVRFVEDLYSRWKFNAFMLKAQQRLVPQTSLIASIDLPRFRRPVWRTWAPWESCAIFTSDPLETDVRFADRVELLVPIAQLAETGVPIYGKRIYTQTEAWTQTETDDGEIGNRVALFPQSEDPDDFRHGFPHIPLVDVRREDALKGWYYPPLALDLLATQIGVNIDLSDVTALCRFETFGREALTGPGALVAQEQMVAGPDRLLYFPDDARYSYTATDPKIKDYTDKIEKELMWAASVNYSSIEALTDSRSITGAAKKVERQDQVEERERQETMLRDFEQDMLGLLLMVLGSRDVLARQALRGADGMKVSVVYHYVEPVDNQLQSVQSRQLQYAVGEDSAEEREARVTGSTIDQATDVVAGRREREAARKEAAGIPVGAPTPGVNRIEAAT